MRLSGFVWLAIVGMICLGAMPGCRRRAPVVPETEGEAETVPEPTEPEEAPPPAEAETPPEEPPEEEPPPVETVTPEQEATRLFQTASNLFQEAKTAWKTFRDGGEKPEDWKRADDLLVQALERCDEAIEKDPSFERVQDLAGSIANYRRMIMDMKPD